MPAAQGRLCGVCEGAAWRGTHGQALLPQARQGRAYYHWTPSLPRGAHAP